jgi:hypothetical protein
MKKHEMSSVVAQSANSQVLECASDEDPDK